MPPSSPEETNAPRPLVVLVDDEAHIRNAYSRILGRWFEVQSFARSRELLAEAEQLRPAVFVLDWLMPGMNGLDLCRELRRDPRFLLTPIAFMTSLEPSMENLNAAFGAGADSFLLKGQSINITVSQIRALANHYGRVNHYMRIRAAMLSGLKHDMANWLTGMVTGVEILAMLAEDQDDSIKEQFASAISSGRHVRSLLEDLSEVLGAEWRTRSEEDTPIASRKLLEDAIAETAWMQRATRLEMGEDFPVLGQPRRLTRALYYLFALGDRQVPDGQPLVLFARRDGATGYLGLAVDNPDGRPRTLWNEETFAHPDNKGDAPVLPCEFIRGVLQDHRTHLRAWQEEGKMHFAFALPVA